MKSNAVKRSKTCIRYQDIKISGHQNIKVQLMKYVKISDWNQMLLRDHKTYFDRAHLISFYLSIIIVNEKFVAELNGIKTIWRKNCCIIRIKFLHGRHALSYHQINIRKVKVKNRDNKWLFLHFIFLLLTIFTKMAPPYLKQGTFFC